MFKKMKTLRDVPQIDEENFIFSIGRLRLAPGDVVVLKSPYALDKDQVSYIRERAMTFLSGAGLKNHVLVLTADTDIGVIRPEGPPDAAA